ncbi:hypothetical protein SCHPADRAFT_900786 [Schizopora paradoxa]|uniref:Zn(2)-C6 fungal-type domain-containing protein n=1 Tax=Schizopora paradoxa TaxID=27342 RepID=A0A0H2RZ01_9AGAM|nr:hypothetical protein SCHPADRAFT_900786 [Schizopora paradoxa]
MHFISPNSPLISNGAVTQELPDGFEWYTIEQLSVLFPNDTFSRMRLEGSSSTVHPQSTFWQIDSNGNYSQMHLIGPFLQAPSGSQSFPDSASQLIHPHIPSSLTPSDSTFWQEDPSGSLLPMSSIHCPVDSVWQAFSNGSSRLIDLKGTFWLTHPNGSQSRMHLIVPHSQVLSGPQTLPEVTVWPRLPSATKWPAPPRGTFWQEYSDDSFWQMYLICTVSQTLPEYTFRQVFPDDSWSPVDPNSTFWLELSSGAYLQVYLIVSLSQISSGPHWLPDGASQPPQDSSSVEGPPDAPFKRLQSVPDSPSLGVPPDVPDAPLSFSQSSPDKPSSKVDPDVLDALLRFSLSPPDSPPLEADPDVLASQALSAGTLVDNPKPERGRGAGRGRRSCTPCFRAKQQCNVAVEVPCKRCKTREPEKCRRPINEYVGEGGYFTTMAQPSTSKVA